jgi:hypothetical protein
MGPCASGAPRPPAPAAALHPDQAEVAARLAEALGGALGADVRVSARGTGYRVAFALDDATTALALADRLSSASAGD